MRDSLNTGMPIEGGRRIKVLIIEPTALLMILQRLQGGEFLSVAGLPNDAKIAGAEVQRWPDRLPQIALQIESESFPLTIEGGVFPVFDIRLTSMKPEPCGLQK